MAALPVTPRPRATGLGGGEAESQHSADPPRKASPAEPATWQMRLSGAWGVVGILVLAAALRLYDPGLSEFKLDEARVFAQAKAIAQGRALPTITEPVSIGIPNTSLATWIFALPARVAPDDPSMVIVFSGLLGVAAVACTYLLGATIFGRRVGLIASLLFATSPWAILFGRKIWFQNFPVLTVLFLFFLYLAVVRRQPWGWVLFFVTLAIQIQAHLLGILYLPAAILTVAVFRPPLPALLGGMGGFGLVSLPYAVSLLRTRVDVWATLSGQTAPSSPLFDPEAIKLALWSISGADLEAILGSLTPRFEPFPALLGLLAFPTAGLLVLGLGHSALIMIRREPSAPAHGLLLLWTLAMLLPLAFHPFPLFMHYFDRLLPVPLLVIAVGLSALYRSDGRWRWSALSILGLVASIQVLGVWQLYRVLDLRPSPEPFGLPTKHLVALARAVREDAAALDTEQVTVITEGVDPLYQQWPAQLSAVLEPDLDLRFVGRGGTRALLFSQIESRLYLVTRADPVLDEVLGAWGEEVRSIRLPEGTLARIFHVPAQTEVDLVQQLSLERIRAQFENGAQLVGYRATAPVAGGDSFRAQVLWRFGPMGEGDKAQDYQVFNHLVDAEDNLLGQADGFGLASSEWREGDLVLQWVEIPLAPDLAPGQYYLRTGMYSLRDGSRSPVVDERGHPTEELVQLGPIP